MTNVRLTPPVLNLQLYAGDGVELRVETTDSEGQPWELDGEVRAQIRGRRTDQTAMEEWTVAQEEGYLALFLTGEQTAALVDGGDRFSGAWDLEWVAPGSEPLTILQGDLSCTRDVTR